jgi:hypothetical protein
MTYIVSENPRLNMSKYTCNLYNHIHLRKANIYVFHKKFPKVISLGAVYQSTRRNIKKL